MAANLANYWAGIGANVSVLTWEKVHADDYFLDTNIKRHSLELDFQSNTLPNRLSYNSRRVLALRNFVTAHQSDLVIAFMTSMNCIATIATLGTKCKTIICEHTYPPLTTTSTFWKLTRKVCYGWSSAVVALNHTSADWIKRNTSAKRVFTISNALVWPLKGSEPYVVDYPLSKNGMYILNVGRHSPEKAQDRLINAFSELASNFPEWTLVLAGAGPLTKKLKAQTNKLGLQHRVLFPGHIGNIGDWYEGASIFALSSDIEGFPLSILEAMAAECAVISVNCPTGPSDIIKHNCNGMLVDKTSRALAEGLRKLMVSQPNRSRLVNGARETLCQYSETRVMDQWHQLFVKLGL